MDDNMNDSENEFYTPVQQKCILTEENDQQQIETIPKNSLLEN